VRRGVHGRARHLRGADAAAAWRRGRPAPRRGFAARGRRRADGIRVGDHRLRRRRRRAPHDPPRARAERVPAVRGRHGRDRRVHRAALGRPRRPDGLARVGHGARVRDGAAARREPRAAARAAAGVGRRPARRRPPRRRPGAGPAVLLLACTRADARERPGPRDGIGPLGGRQARPRRPDPGRRRAARAGAPAARRPDEHVLVSGSGRTAPRRREGARPLADRRRAVRRPAARGARRRRRARREPPPTRVAQLRPLRRRARPRRPTPAPSCWRSSSPPATSCSRTSPAAPRGRCASITRR